MGTQREISELEIYSAEYGLYPFLMRRDLGRSLDGAVDPWSSVAHMIIIMINICIGRNCMPAAGHS